MSLRKLKPDILETVKLLSADIKYVQAHLYDKYGELNEFLAEELYVLQGEYKAIIDNPESYM